MPHRRALLREVAGPPADLSDVSQLGPVALGLRVRSISDFAAWLQRRNIGVVVEAFDVCPLILDQLVAAYGAALYAVAAPLYTYLMTLTGVQSQEPGLRKALSHSC
jgi:hypothetical protein